MDYTPTELAGGILTIIFAIDAVFQRYKNSKKVKKSEQDDDILSEAKMYREKSNLMQKAAEENLKLYRTEKEDHNLTRKFWHDKSSEYQTDLTKCQTQIIELQSRPDLTDILNIVKDQSRTSVEILQGIADILKFIKEDFQHEHKS